MARANLEMPRPPAAEPNTDAGIAAEIRRLTRRSFTTGAIAALAGGAAAAWLATRPAAGGIPWPLRRVLEGNEHLARLLSSNSRLAPEFPVARAVDPRVNGRVGLHTPLNVEMWAVQVAGKAEQRIPLTAILALPTQEM